MTTEKRDPFSTPPPTSTHASAGAYQRQRLWCGVVGIGAVLVFLWAGMWWGLPDVLKGAFGGLPPVVAGGLVALLTAVVVSGIQLPFDFFGGRVVEGNFRQIDFGARFDWGKRYIWGVVEWVVVLTVAGAVVGWMVGRWPGMWPVVAPMVLMGLAGLQFCIPIPPGPRARPGVARRPWTEQLKAELAKQKLAMPAMGYYEHGERSLGGGWAGVGRMRMLWVTRTVWELTPRTAAALVSRELGHLRLGHRGLSFLATGAWVVAGFVVASMVLPGRWLESPGAAVFGVMGVMSTWCWVSLLFVFPAMGRWQVYSADRAMLEAGFTLEEGLAALDALSDRNKPDEKLPAGIAFVFHPIPPMEMRREALRKFGKGGH